MRSGLDLCVGGTASGTLLRTRDSGTRLDAGASHCSVEQRSVAPFSAADAEAVSEAEAAALGAADLDVVADLRHNIRSLSQRISMAARSSRKRSMAELR